MNPTTTAEKIIQSVCELQEVPDLDHPETIVISVTDLRTIVENHIAEICHRPVQFLPSEDGEFNGNSLSTPHTPTGE